jgi:hypothetical protein
MGEVLQKDLGERERLLLLAAYLHGVRPGARIHANCWRVLRQALFWAGLLDEQMESDTRHDVENPVIADWYRALISMVRQTPETERLIQGYGNLGSGTHAPAFPSNTGCGLTDKGCLTKRCSRRRPRCWFLGVHCLSARLPLQSLSVRQSDDDSYSLWPVESPACSRDQ